MDEVTYDTPEQIAKIQAFWTWFAENQAKIHGMQADDEAARDWLFENMGEQLAKVETDLTFELGPVADGVRELIISASGIQSAFPAVEAVMKHAPKLGNWSFGAFRPRRSPLMNIEVDDLNIDPANVWVQLYQDEEAKGKIGLVLHLDGYSEEVADIYHQVSYLLLDEALGEFDVETKVGFIDFEALTDDELENALPLTELAPVFDEFYGELNPA